MNEDIIVGRHAVKSAAASDREINKVFIQEGINKQQIKPILDLLKERKIMVQQVPKSKLDQMSDVPHQGIAAQISPYDYTELEDFIEAVKDKTATVMILDGLEDPHNLGSIIRTADAIGVDGIIIPKRRSVTLNATVVKASTGAIEHVPVMRVTNLAQTMDRLKEAGFWICGTDAQQSVDYRKMDADMPLAIVIGSEGEGMSRLVKEKCDFLVHLPMVGHVNSLNASVAAGLLMYEVYRKRHAID
ncbi:23S rRNA (guanosine(2251)-2'-O)-methyltransferase RlmB [Macrococcus equipercicus]|uniref:Putative TrmH family tRNA/rRNA methyltransferase n=1 Tax=Macrococcus equipercicus TaxID=69967 RepID=A0A9Q9BQM0_9STAP|nr:23S rRNA (guanosine(2251)-2'-O)-methyltransferase RlmB [Macrococcus equipercicus]KAA1039406.1 23S rRNA (guanosine(2251)-2'-O)-methyltransferase RlmB [Macrococcus equipercicus]UTH13699.1 23S rRNA (guanosine(2251)-2'-O)-methyltransferase RlmB [Macrococcus equipercicus]